MYIKLALEQNLNIGLISFNGSLVNYVFGFQIKFISLQLMKRTFPLDHVYIGSDAGNNNIYFI